MAETLGKNLWNLLVKGVLSVFIGLIALFLPGELLYVFIFAFALAVIASGGWLILQAFRNRTKNTNDNETLLKIAEGIICIVLGIVIINIPKTSLGIIMVIVGIWAAAAGVFQIVSAVKLRKVFSNEWLGILNGLFTILFGILIFINLYAGAQAIVMMYGVFAILSGIFTIMYAFRLNRLQNT